MKETPTSPAPEESFESHRPRLLRLAYRILGSLADAEDVLQEAFLRWNDRHNEARSAEAYLHTIVTRLSIDRRRKVEAAKETYIGPWLPEPLVEPPSTNTMEREDEISLAFMVVLESLNPTERAAFVLRRAFDFDYRQIAEILEKSEANCRQLVSRAEAHVQAERPRFETTRAAADQMTDAFLQACHGGDMDSLLEMLTADAVLYSDGGGKASAAMVPILGADKVARLFLGIFRKAPSDVSLCRLNVNGMPGIAAMQGGQVVTLFTLEFVDGRITNCYVFRNPDKLARATAVAAGVSPGEDVT